ncbi:MAG: hypothetical protein EB089_04775 [Acidimicrobiia bacterium]|nr:hypothetical protein [Acidimicrobiia bacterium]
MAPVGDTTRPTTDMAREAIFNALTSMDVITDARGEQQRIAPVRRICVGSSRGAI